MARESIRKKVFKRIEVKDSIGVEFSKEDNEQIFVLAQEIKNNFEMKNKHIEYLEKVMQRLCPNILGVAGVLIGAKLLSHAGSLKRLMELPTGTLQLLGAEKALFRHIRRKTKPPKYGVIINHPILIKAKEKGKAARVVASALSIAAKVDYFKGEYMAEKLLKDIERKLNPEINEEKNNNNKK